jgi:hypothetical protein
VNAVIKQTIAAALVLLAGAAQAQPRKPQPPTASDEAKRLFDQGLADMMAGRYDAGCPALASSYSMTQALGALFTLAECESRWGKLGSAYKHYQAFVAAVATLPPSERSKQDDRRRLATSQIESLRDVVPRLTIVPPARVGPEPRVEIDGEALAPESIGVVLYLDEGSHRVVFIDRERRHEQVVDMRRGDDRQLVLELPPETPAPAPAPPSPVPEPSPRPEVAPDDGSALPAVGWVAFALGGAGLVAGAVAGGLTLASASDLEARCPGRVCAGADREDYDRTVRLGNVTTVLLVAGGAVLGAGSIVLIVSATDDGAADAATLGVRVGMGSLAIEGAMP